MMDQIEKLTITRDMKGTVVKLVVTEDGITVNYSIKTYTAAVPESIRLAREQAKTLLFIAKASDRTTE